MDDVKNNTRSSDINAKWVILAGYQQTKIDEARAAGAEFFMDLPDAWYEPRPTYACPNGHVQHSILKSETRGNLCFTCQESLAMIPEITEDQLRMELTEYAATMNDIQLAESDDDEFNSAAENSGQEPSFQERVSPWMEACFGEKITYDPVERNYRFLEESLKLVQACNLSRAEAHKLVDYVYDRAIGAKPQEVGGVMVSLAALCLAHNMDMHHCGEVELKRIWTKVASIRLKQARKPRFTDSA